MSDIGLFINEQGSVDLRLKNGDLEGDDGLETAVIVSLFTDRRVSNEEIPQNQTSRRGWWGDRVSEIDGDQIGSRLWTLERSKRTQETLNLAEDYTKEALNWLVEDGVADSIEVTAQFEGSISEGKWTINILILKPRGQESRFKVLWDKQELIRG